jgi:hypothetical protein
VDPYETNADPIYAPLLSFIPILMKFFVFLSVCLAQPIFRDLLIGTVLLPLIKFACVFVSPIVVLNF